MKSPALRFTAALACCALLGGTVETFGYSNLARIVGTQTMLIRHKATEEQKRVAQQRGVTLDALAEEGLRHALQAHPEPAPSAAPTPLPQAADSIDLLGTAGAPVLKRAIPAALILVAVVGIIWIIARRRG